MIDKILAIDYGSKFTGFALSDETGTLATALPPLIQTNTQKQQIFISQLVKRHEINHILLGLPTGLAQKPTQISKQVEKFGEEVARLTGLPVKYWNETGTSKQAEQSFNRKKALQSHSEAARIMLQEFLDFQRTGI
jgi:putative transcription antitermination factor YqgF